MDKATIQVLTKEIFNSAKSFKKSPRANFVVGDFRNIEKKAREGIKLSEGNEEIKKRFNDILTRQQRVRRNHGRGVEDCLKNVRELALEIQALLKKD